MNVRLHVDRHGGHVTPFCIFGRHAPADVEWTHSPSGKISPLCHDHYKSWLLVAAECDAAKPLTVEVVRPTHDFYANEEEDVSSHRGNLPRVEPGADQRQAALSLRQLYVALVESGFTERQALTLVGEALAGAVGGVATASGDD